jgi:hypothetical protein
MKLEPRPYGPDSTSEEIRAIQDCLCVCADDIGDIVEYHEVPVLSLFQVGLFHQRLDDIARTLPRYALLVDLTNTFPPDAEIRARLKQMFASQHNLRRVAVYTGPNFMLSVAAKFVFAVLGMQRFSVHETREEALEVLRRGD